MAPALSRGLVWAWIMGRVNGFGLRGRRWGEGWRVWRLRLRLRKWWGVRGVRGGREGREGRGGKGGGGKGRGGKGGREGRERWIDGRVVVVVLEGLFTSSSSSGLLTLAQQTLLNPQ